MPTTTSTIDTATVRRISSAELGDVLRPLVRIFAEAVNENHGLGYVPPITEEVSLNYWLSFRRELDEGSRILLVASIGDQIVGSGQLALSPRANGKHRAEVQKVFVDTAARGRGVGRAIMEALHRVALEHQRTLLILDTRVDGAGHKLYLSMGYEELGIIPGYALAADGVLAGTIYLYKHLTP